MENQLMKNSIYVEFNKQQIIKFRKNKCRIQYIKNSINAKSGNAESINVKDNKCQIQCIQNQDIPNQ